ncbi:unnamed protein product [Candidula unifasciata]|uniref:F-box domain-containing protein n=1 Tax=Candidula unifasciata TaxID=100452 RepID=A0A8S3ZTC2_9EUPU|nr:unnamed protein product [Candidula unifasciata]
MSFAKLPDEKILMEIMQYLPMRDRCRARRVCKEWYRILYDKCLGRHADLLEFPIDLKTMWKLVRYHFCQCLLTLKIRGFASADGSSNEKPSVSMALLRELTIRCPNLQLLNFTECKTSTVSVERLPPSITCLEMVNSRWQLRWLHGTQMYLPKLQYLNLDKTLCVDNYDLQDIAGFRNLKYLSLNNCYCIGSLGVRIIAVSLLDLEVLNLTCVSIDDLTVHYIALHLKKLKELCLCSCRSLTDRAVTSIAQGLPVLNKLDISYCPHITMRGLESLFFSKLSVLIIQHLDKWSEEEIQNLRSGFPENFILEAFDLLAYFNTAYFNILPHI